MSSQDLDLEKLGKAIKKALGTKVKNFVTVQDRRGDYFGAELVIPKDMEEDGVDEAFVSNFVKEFAKSLHGRVEVYGGGKNKKGSTVSPRYYVGADGVLLMLQVTDMFSGELDIHVVN